MKKIIQEWEVDKAAQKSTVFVMDEQSRLTPAAHDRLKELGLTLQIEKSSAVRQTAVKDILPVKIVALAADHGGFEVKEMLREFLRKKGYKVHDLGPSTDAACDYPDYAVKVARMVADQKADCGIMIDSVGIGSAIAANRVKGILAAKCNTAFEARSAREHNYANVLTLGSKTLGLEIIKEIVTTFLNTAGGAERHQRRVKKILDLD